MASNSGRMRVWAIYDPETCSNLAFYEACTRKEAEDHFAHLLPLYTTGKAPHVWIREIETCHSSHHRGDRHDEETVRMRPRYEGSEEQIPMCEICAMAVNGMSLIDRIEKLERCVYSLVERLETWRVR